MGHGAHCDCCKTEVKEIDRSFYENTVSYYKALNNYYSRYRTDFDYSKRIKIITEIDRLQKQIINLNQILKTL